MKVQKMVFLLGTVSSILPLSSGTYSYLQPHKAQQLLWQEGLRRQWRQDGLRGAAHSTKKKLEKLMQKSIGVVGLFLSTVSRQFALVGH